MPINKLSISYGDFVLNTVIDPEQVDINNLEIVSKVNNIIDAHNDLNATKIPITAIAGLTGTNIQSLVQSLKTYVDKTGTDLSGVIGTLTDNINIMSNNIDANISGSVSGVRHELEAHIEDTTNPHKVTANQLGVYTKAELDPYLRGGDTIIKYDVFTIVNSNNGDGTFTYADSSGNNHIGTLNAQGQQVFTLLNGFYTVGQNRIECTINDTLSRSVASGGLTELSPTTIVLTSPEGNGAEITFKYFEKIGVIGTGLIIISPTKPPSGYVWFEELV
jgi:hypothetical protein